MVYIIIVMVLIFIAIFAVQYKIALDHGDRDIRQILENTVLWSIISYVVIGIILLGITLLTTSET